MVKNTWFPQRTVKEFSGLPAFRRNGDIFLALGFAGVDWGGGGCGGSSAMIPDVDALWRKNPRWKNIFCLYWHTPGRQMRQKCFQISMNTHEKSQVSLYSSQVIQARYGFHIYMWGQGSFQITYTKLCMHIWIGMLSYQGMVKKTWGARR